MKNIIAAILITNMTVCVGQTLKTTYYDKQKTKKDEVYQTDANGTINGSYKHYDQEGALINEGTFKSGKKNGVFIEYAKFPNYAGKLQIKSNEAFVDDLKEGPAKYYMYREELGVYELQNGNYHQNKEEGIWIKIRPVTDDISATTYGEREAKINELTKNPIYKNSLGIKTYQKYQNGEAVSFNDTTINETYYPSGKLYTKIVWKNGKVESRKTFYPDGKDKVSGYNYDGSPDEATKKGIELLGREQEIKKQYADDLNGAVNKANALSETGKYAAAINVLSEGIQKYKNSISTYQAVSDTMSSLKFAQAELTSVKKLQADNQALMDSFTLNYKTYTKTFKGDEFVNEHNMNDFRYPKGKITYEKIDQIIIADLTLAKSAKDVFEQQIIINRLNRNIGKLLKYTEEEWSAMGKKLKKSETSEEIKSITNLE